MVKDTDYTVSYGANTNAGEGTVTINGKDNYSGSIAAKFTIGKADITITGLTGSTSKPYDGNTAVRD